MLQELWLLPENLISTRPIVCMHSIFFILQNSIIYTQKNYACKKTKRAGIENNAFCIYL
jgi:hypothetical protein